MTPLGNKGKYKSGIGVTQMAPNTADGGSRERKQVVIMINKDTVLFIGMLNELAAKSRNGILPSDEHEDYIDDETDYVWYDSNTLEKDPSGATEYYKVATDVLDSTDVIAHYDEDTMPYLKGIQVRVVIHVDKGVFHERPFIEIKDESEEFYIIVEDGEWYEDY